MDRYVDATAVGLLDGLAIRDALARPCAPDELLAARGFVAGFGPALRWLLARLARTGVLAVEGGRYRVAPAISASDAQANLAAVLERDPSYAPALTLVDEAAAIYPRVARGEVSGEHALFRKLTLWTSYFDNANRYYALNNVVAARAVADRLPATIVELGAGLGSATEALLDALAARGRRSDLGAYRFTEPVPFFRRRAERALRGRHPDVAWTFESLDLNLPWAEQGVPPGSAGLVWGVNVFHLARSLPETLPEARTALAPGGWLDVGEGVRPRADAPVGAEFPFLLLESFTAVELDPATRPTAGFLTAAHWQRALTVAGFSDVTLVPDVARLAAIHPGFYAAAICARKP
jgi:SAM-dependent methyltransferase